MNNGLIYLYTGDGAGKSTAAMGYIFRALGHNWKICMIQFLKGSSSTGEMKIAKMFPELLVFQEQDVYLLLQCGIVLFNAD